MNTKTDKFLVVLALVLTAHALHAGSATWNVNPTSNDWNTAANWTPATIPSHKTDLATFGTSSTVDVICGDAPGGAGGDTIVGGIIFAPDASSYTVTITPVFDIGGYPSILEIYGAGITNNSGRLQSFVTANSGTTISAGTLRLSNRRGSATGTGSVNVNAGTLGGKGSISGAVTIGTGSGSGAFLAPSVTSNQPLTLTMKKTLSFKAHGTYTCKLNTNTAKADQVNAKGVSIEAGAQFSFQAVANKKLSAGAVFTAINNSSANPIAGFFANLADGSSFTSGRNKFQVNYEGGD